MNADPTRWRWLLLRLIAPPALLAAGCFGSDLQPSPAPALGGSAVPLGEGDRRPVEANAARPSEGGRAPGEGADPPSASAPEEGPASTSREVALRYRIEPLRADQDPGELAERAVAVFSDRLTGAGLLYGDDFDVQLSGRARREVRVVLRGTAPAQLARLRPILENSGALEICFFLDKALHDHLTSGPPPEGGAGTRMALVLRKVECARNDGGDRVAYVTDGYHRVLVKTPLDFTLSRADWESVEGSAGGVRFQVAAGSRERWRRYFEVHRGGPYGLCLDGVLRHIGTVNDEFLDGRFTLPAFADEARMKATAAALRMMEFGAKVEPLGEE
ncbi:MAG: hypothetical protein HY719_04310 [Planctomycetes bacterium]|nr:hypothetical protein [Planctomycetota bacterium]